MSASESPPTSDAEGPDSQRSRPTAGYYWRRSRQLLRAGYRGVNSARYRVNQEVVGVTPETLGARVAVYYPDTPVKIYQVKQWLPVLESVHAEIPVVLVTRSESAYHLLAELTWLPRVCLPKLGQLSEFYASSELAVALYVNNGVRNFQSLSWQRMIHMHINHGESDKLSMVSNQAKAYDRVAVAGEAARMRHNAALIEFDDSTLIPIGRPQLDLLPPFALDATTRHTILYAPTWEGETDLNNYSSVDAFGPALVRQLMAVPESRVVYKPHPRTVTSTNPRVAQAHLDIVAMLETSKLADPAAEHAVLQDADILSILPGADLFIGDVSSVTLDYLYLRVEQPLMLCDRHGDLAGLVASSPAAVAADVITAASVHEVAGLVTRRLDGDDPLAAERARVREMYFGQHRPGESVRHFLSVLHELVAVRDRDVAQLSSSPTLAVAGMGAAISASSTSTPYSTAPTGDGQRPVAESSKDVQP